MAWTLGAGYEGWVGSDWGVGALLRLDGMSLKGTGDAADAKATVLSPALVFTATYNLASARRTSSSTSSVSSTPTASRTSPGWMPTSLSACSSSSK